MYGKCFESMYEGSMIGAGIHVFAVWNYIITKARGGAVEINPKLLAFTLGGTEEQVRDALKFLCDPDPESRSKEEGGRRIIREGEFQYHLVNWEFYQKIRNADDKREYNRMKQQEYRAIKKKVSKNTMKNQTPSSHLAGEDVGVKQFADGLVDKHFVPIVKTKADLEVEQLREESV